MARRKKVPVWIGRAISALVTLAFVASGVMKLVGGEELKKGIAHLGLSESIVLPLAILELTCAAIYLIPATSVLGAILLTGYLGGAILSHWRVGDPFYGPVIIGIFVWLGVALRDDRLWKLIPIRRPNAPTDVVTVE